MHEFNDYAMRLAGINEYAKSTPMMNIHDFDEYA